MRSPSFQQILAHPSNIFFLIGSMWGIGALVHPCPTCIAGTGGFFARGAMERINSTKRWMDRVFHPTE